MLEERLRTIDRAKRKEIYAKLQRMYLDESFAIAMYGLVDLVGKKKALAGYKDNPYCLDTGKFVREWYWE